MVYDSLLATAKAEVEREFNGALNAEVKEASDE